MDHKKKLCVCTRLVLHTQVSWSEVRRTVSWLLANLTVTDITPGDSVSFYVQLTEMVYVSLRLPRLAMQSAR